MRTTWSCWGGWKVSQQRSLKLDGLHAFTLLLPTPSTYVLAAILSQRLRGSLLDVRSLLSNNSNPWHFVDKPASSMRPTAFSSQLHPPTCSLRFSRNDCVDLFWTLDLSLKQLQSVAFRRQTSFIHASNGVLLPTPSTLVLAAILSQRLRGTSDLS